VATANAGATNAFYTATALKLTQDASSSNSTATVRAQMTSTAAAQLTANANATSVVLTGTAAATATNIAATNAAATQTATAFPKFTFSTGALAVNENAGTAPITINLSPTINAPSSITVVAVDGSASSPSDYTFTTVTVPFLANQSTATVNVNIVDSPLTNEPSETFSLLLSAPSAGTGLGTPGSIVITINDVTAPTFTLSSSVYSGTEQSGRISVTINLSIPPTAGTRDVTISTAATGSSSTDATPGVDFTSVNQVVSFGVGQTTPITIDIVVVDDGIAESNETFQVILSAPVGGVIGSPGSATATIENSPQASVGFMAGGYSFAEGSGGGTTVVTIPVTLSRAYANGPGATVNYSVLGSSTAVGGAACGGVVDYQTPVAGTLTFPAGSTTPTVPLQITLCADNLNEANDTINLTLSNPVNAAFGVATTTVNILNDDTPPAIVLNMATFPVTEPGGLGTTTTVAITASLTGTSGQTITANYATADVTATNGVDYVGVTGTLTFNPGSITPVTQIPAITINGDILNETTETFTLTLSNPTGGATVGAPGAATVNISDDGDIPPTVTFSAVPYITPEGNVSGTVTITVNFDRPSGQTVSLGYGTSAGPITCGVAATAGVDYQTTSGTLNYNPGEMSKTFTVTINGDATAEPNECFALNLGLSSGAANGLPANSEVWIQNDD